MIALMKTFRIQMKESEPHPHPYYTSRCMFTFRITYKYSDCSKHWSSCFLWEILTDHNKTIGIIIYIHIPIVLLTIPDARIVVCTKTCIITFPHPKQEKSSCRFKWKQSIEYCAWIYYTLYRYNFIIQWNPETKLCLRQCRISVQAPSLKVSTNGI